jgi:peptide/nickel transport system substrate-binding protein
MDRWGTSAGRARLVALVLAAVGLLVVGFGGSTNPDSVKASSRSKDGGTLTVLVGGALGGWPSGLDPVTSHTTLADAQLLNAVYGELFEVGAHNRVLPDLATDYSITNGGKTLTIDLRHGVSFSDGTAFNASAVVYNFNRSLADLTSASNPPWPPHAAVSAPDPYTVVVQFSAPDGAALEQLLNTNLTWIASPTALKNLGEQRFSVAPVGAGPFEVESDTLSTKLVLKKNPNYWEKGHPYLDGLTFATVANDESALEDLQAHDAQAYLGMGTPQLVHAYKSAGFTVTADPGSAVVDIELENGFAPFNNIKAREALYYAIDAATLNKKLYNGTCAISQSFTGPGGLFYEPKVPGYRTYDLAKARALVKSLGGLSFTMYFLDNGLYVEEAPTLQTMFKAAGMHVTIDGIPQLAPAIAEFDTHKWQAYLWVMGSYDPAGGIGVSFFLASTGPFSGIHDPTVDKYIDQGAASVSTKARATAYSDLAKYVSQQAYAPYICAASSWDVTKKGVSGPGLTTAYGSFGQGPLVQWENVTVKSG